MGHTHGITWSDALIKEKILEVVSSLGLSEMPTRNQIRGYFGDDKLTNKISKTLGYYGWADRLGLPIQNNDTRKGKLAEQLASDILAQKGYKVEQMLQNYPFDLLVNNTVRVDVKYAKLNVGKYFSYALRKKYPTCDIYMLVEDHGGDDQRVYIVPSKFAVQTQICTGATSTKYSEYLDRYDYIDRFAWLFDQIE